jgi:L-arabinose isomerase
MNQNADKFRVGVIPVMIDLYNRLAPAVRSSYQKFSDEVAGKLGNRELAVESGPVASHEKDIRAACKKYEKAGVDLLVVSHVSYCESGKILPALLDSALPVVLWPGQPMSELEPRRYNSETVMLNHGVHGAQDLASMLRRRKRPYGIIHGHWSEPGFKKEILEWARAGRVLRAMKGSNPVMVGGHFDQMLDLQMEGSAFLKEFGVTGREITTKEFLKFVKSVGEKEIKEKTEQYRSVFEMAKGVGEELLRQTARHEVGLRKVLDKYKSKAVGINFLSLCNDRTVGDGLHVAASMLEAERVGYGGEGDWVTAMLVRGLQSAEPATSFTEIFSVGYKDGRLVLRHWGEGNLSMARSKPILRASQFNDTVSTEFAVTDFEFMPGRATIVNLNVTPEGRGQLMTIQGEIVKDHLPAVDGPRGIFKPKCSDIRDLLTQYAYQGGSHHLAMVRGEAEEMIDRVARLSGWAHVSI